MKYQAWFNLLARLGLALAVGMQLAGRMANVNAQGPTGSAGEETAIGTSFTYEGRLTNSDGRPAEGIYDFVFKLHDSASTSGSHVVGVPLSLDNVPVTDGGFRVELDFGRGVFTGKARYLEVSVRPGPSSGPYTTISLRQRVTTSPYALALPGLWTQPNPASPNLIGGYSENSIPTGVTGGVISGGGARGFTNRVTDDFGAVGGGRNNQAGDNAGTTGDAGYATVSGGLANVASNGYATVGGGWLNTASGPFSVIGGGSQNSAGNLYTTIGGGLDNTASGVQSTIGGGWLNSATNAYATIGGGYSNKAGEVYTAVGGGSYNTANGSWAVIGGGYNNSAGGPYSAIPGGKDNLAQGDYSFAAGYGARANAPGCFVWADAAGGELACNEANCFMARASGGVYLYTSPDLSVGAQLPAGSGSWAVLSDQRVKANLEPVDGRDVLARLSKVPIHTWNYQTQDPSLRHIGPAAQDFYAAFGVGEDERYISTVDADGVALAAIQGLYQITQAQAARIAVQQAQIEALQQQNAGLETRLAALEKWVETQSGSE